MAASKQAAVGVGVEGSVFVWRDPESATGVKDPSELPANREDHAERSAAGLWGPRYARLCPGHFESRSGNEVTVSVIDGKHTESVVVPTSALIPWFEGLLLLDVMSKAGDKTPWFKDLAPLLEQQRAKLKNGQLSAAVYVSKKIINVAVTGPSFISGDGKKYAHRRTRMYEHMPQAPDEPVEGYYTVDALAEYLPPWEAFLHPKCGLYQDFYIVQWGPPFSKANYSVTEHGCDGFAGATWEPDECLPDDLDQLRIAAKHAWVQQQRVREQQQMKWKEVDRLLRGQTGERWDARATKRATLSNGDGHDPAAKRRLVYNPRNLSLKDDLWQTRLRSGLVDHLKSEDNEEVKKGWPKTLDQYPCGYGPAMPPGNCTEECDCMEDWHFGRNFANALGVKPWIEEADRSGLCKEAIDAFKATGFPRTRGQVSQKWHLEPNIPEEPKPAEGEVNIFARLILRVMREASQSIPLNALRAEAAGSSGLLRALAVAFAAGGEAAYEPMTYEVVEGPPWLDVERQSGKTAVLEDALPPELLTTPGMSVRLRVSLGNTSSLGPMPDYTMDCKIVSHVPDTGEQTFAALTERVVSGARDISSGRLRSIVLERLALVYDAVKERVSCPPAGVWAHALSEAATSMKVAAFAHVVPRGSQ